VLHVLEGTDVSDPESVVEVLYPTEEQTGRVDDLYTTTNRLTEINVSTGIEYDVVTPEPTNKIGAMELETIYIVYYYKRAEGKVIIKHVDINSNEEIYDQETQNGMVGEEYNTSNKLTEINEIELDKYEYVKVEGNESGEFAREDQEVIYYYQKKATNVIVRYVEINTEEELYGMLEIAGRIEDDYVTEDKIEAINSIAKNKYQLVMTTENLVGKMEEGTIEVIYYYKKIDSKVIIKYLDYETGEEIELEGSVEGFVNDEYTTRPKEIEGYELIEERIPVNKDGEIDEEIIEVRYYYRKIVEPEINIETGDINIISLIGIMGISLLGIKKYKRIKE